MRYSEILSPEQQGPVIKAAVPPFGSLPRHRTLLYVRGRLEAEALPIVRVAWLDVLKLTLPAQPIQDACLLLRQGPSAGNGDHRRRRCLLRLGRVLRRRCLWCRCLRWHSLLVLAVVIGPRIRWILGLWGGLLVELRCGLLVGIRLLWRLLR